MIWNFVDDKIPKLFYSSCVNFNTLTAINERKIYDGYYEDKKKHSCRLEDLLISPIIKKLSEICQIFTLRLYRSGGKFIHVYNTSDVFKEEIDRRNTLIPIPITQLKNLALN